MFDQTLKIDLAQKRPQRVDQMAVNNSNCKSHLTTVKSEGNRRQKGNFMRQVIATIFFASLLLIGAVKGESTCYVEQQLYGENSSG